MDGLIGPRPPCGAESFPLALGFILSVLATTAVIGGRVTHYPLSKTNLWFVPGLATARVAILENFEKAAAIFLS